MVSTRPPKRPRRWRRALCIALGAFLVLSIGALIAVPVAMMPGMTGRVAFREVYDAADYGLDARPLTLTTSDGLSIAAWQVEAPRPRAYVVFVSGIHNPSVTAFFGHARWLRDNGYSSVLVEQRAHGASEGTRIALGMEEYLDVQAAVDHIDAIAPDAPIVAYGVSMGGATAVTAIGNIDRIDALVSLSAYASWTDAFADNMETMGFPPFLCALERPFVSLYVGFAYGFDALANTPKRAIGDIGDHPALLMHSTGDGQVPFVNLARLQEAAGDADLTTFVREGDHHMIVEDYDHPEGDAEYARAVLSFLDRLGGDAR